MTKRRRGNARRSAQPTNADEAMEDARAEVDDVAAAVETGESSAAAAGAPAACSAGWKKQKRKPTEQN
jgi:hypothetical protein